jgi:hypothetical protein
MRKSIKVYFDGLSWDKIEWAQSYSKIRPREEFTKLVVYVRLKRYGLLKNNL